MFGASVPGPISGSSSAQRERRGAERRVHVPDPAAGEERGGDPHRAREHEPVHRVVPLRAHAEHEVAVVAAAPRGGELGDDELPVGVDLEDPLGPRAEVRA